MDSVGSDVGTRCKLCGQKYLTVWRAIDKLWTKITGITDESGLWCPHCFSEEARAKDIVLRWTCGDEVWPDVPEQMVRQGEYITQLQAELEAARGQIEEFCGELCNKRPMSTHCERCPFYNATLVEETEASHG